MMIKSCNKKIFTQRVILFLAFSFFMKPSIVMADQYSKAIAINPHIRVINYSPNEMHRYTGYYNYAASIVLDNGEKISTIAIGDPTAWQITPAGNRMFIKPLQDNAETNALIITNRRVYHIALDAKEAKGIDDKNLVLETRFAYPQINYLQNTSQESSIPDINDSTNLNFHYLLSGMSEGIKPIRVFDDGRFTYFQFPENNVTLPAIFDVNEQGAESVVNVRTVGKHMIVEKVGSLFTLRYDKEHVCVFNEDRPLNAKRSKIEKILASERLRKEDEVGKRKFTRKRCKSKANCATSE